MTHSTQQTAPLYSTLSADPILAEIVDLFVDEMPLRVEIIQEQLANSAWEGLQRTAHQLKGSAGSYGFTPITTSAAGLEEAIREKLPEETISSAAAELVSLCQRASSGSGQ